MRKIVEFLFFVLTIGFLALLLWAAPTRVDPMKWLGQGPLVRTVVTSGMGARQAADAFARSGAVADSRDLARWMAKMGIDRRLVPGIYELHAGSAWDVAHQLAKAKPIASNITIVPGMMPREIAGALAAQSEALSIDRHADYATLLNQALARDENFPPFLRERLPQEIPNRAIFLLPETYRLVPGASGPDELVRMASGSWASAVGNFAPDDASAQELLDAGILASLVQWEGRVDAERPRIAGVLEKRLEIGMPLQCDASIVYFMKMRGEPITRVLHSHLTIDDPYNTYLYKGLPPGPIGIPNTASWRAALRPEVTGELYYVARGDGTHIFSRTYAQHLDAIKRARSAP